MKHCDLTGISTRYYNNRKSQNSHVIGRNHSLIVEKQRNINKKEAQECINLQKNARKYN